MKEGDVPKIEIINKNSMMIDGEEYQIKEYLKLINSNSEDFLADSKYFKCNKCKNNINKYFCKNCNINICEKCSQYNKCKENNHILLELADKENKANIEEAKNIINKNILPMKEDDETIKIIIEYIDKNVINNNIDIENVNPININLSSMKDIYNQDILLINLIISVDYINYNHYQNIIGILKYLKNNYNTDNINKYKGYGKLLYVDGEYYIGEFKDGKRSGKGILLYNGEKLIFFGGFEGDKLVGSGDFENQNYIYYIGQWSDNLRNGKGILKYDDRRIYKGDFLNDVITGYGKSVYDDGKYYIGERKYGSKDGKGTLYYKNGTILYQGKFLKNKYEGEGKYIDEDGNYYIGEWKNGLKHGKGQVFLSNGTMIYNGEFALGKPKLECIIN